MTKEEILRLLRSIAADRGGDVSFRTFLAASGLKEKQIVGAHWATWNDAKREAGLSTGVFVPPSLDEDVVLTATATLVAKLGKWPTESQLRLAKKHDQRVPSVKVFRRLEQDREFMTKLRAYCEGQAYSPGVVRLIDERARKTSSTAAVPTVPIAGYVYMMRSGRRYKVGHTSSPTRRHREVRIDLPDRTDLVHSIETDDPRGIELYWHTRFADKRVRDTEFFELSASDVAAFKKRKFQ